MKNSQNLFFKFYYNYRDYFLKGVIPYELGIFFWFILIFIFFTVLFWIIISSNFFLYWFFHFEIFLVEHTKKNLFYNILFSTMFSLPWAILFVHDDRNFFHEFERSTEFEENVVFICLPWLLFLVINIPFWIELVNQNNLGVFYSPWWYVIFYIIFLFFSVIITVHFFSSLYSNKYWLIIKIRDEKIAMEQNYEDKIEGIRSKLFSKIENMRQQKLNAKIISLLNNGAAEDEIPTLLINDYSV